MRYEAKFFVQVAASTFDFPDPIVEVGSYLTEGQEGVADLRPMFPNKTYVGIDIRPGPGVDAIEDVHCLSFPDESVGSILCCDTLEHVPNVWKAVSEMRRVLRKGGILLITSVMNFPIHNYPADYWRFTPQAFCYLLRDIGPFAVFFQGSPEFPLGVYGIAVKALPSRRLDEFTKRVVELTQRWDDPLVLFYQSLDPNQGTRSSRFVDPEGALRYELQVETLPEENVLKKALNFISRGSRILEIGCATGYFGSYLQREFGCKVVAVEVDAEAALTARKRGIEVIIGDVESEKTLRELKGPFDCVLLLDVLEHLRHPDVLLKRIRPMVAEGGFVLASVPNVAYAGLVGELLRGIYRYRRSGILDKTHLRFFTKENAVDLFEGAGYYVERIERIKIPVERTEFDPLWPELTPVVEKFNPEAYTYQFLIKAVPASEAAALERLSSRLVQLEEQLQTAMVESRYKEGLLRDLHQQLRDLMVRIADLESQNQELKTIVEEQQKERQLLQNELRSIYISKSWKLVSFLRTIKNCLLLKHR